MENKAKEARIKKAREIIAIIQMILFSVATIIIIVSIITFGLNTRKISPNSVFKYPYLYEDNGYYVNFDIWSIILSFFTLTLFISDTIWLSVKYYQMVHLAAMSHYNHNPLKAGFYFFFLLIPVYYCIILIKFEQDFAYMYGRIFGIPLLVITPALIYNLVEIIIAIVKTIKQREIDHEKEKERQAKKQQEEAELAKKKQLEDDYQNTISQIGKKFFVNYYPKLKNWNEIDIADEIKDMNYESKMSRIKNAKKLFDNKWDERFTREIANSSTTEIDETTIKMAQAIIDVYYKK